MKRICYVFLSLILIFSATTFGCKDFSYGEPCADNKHAYGAYVYQNDATCFENGTEVARCTNPYCSAKLTRTAQNTKLTHSLEKHSACAPTCYSVGYSSAFYECIHCHTYYSQNNAIDENILQSIDHMIIPKTEHTYELSYTVDVLATNHEEGLKSRHCVNFDICGARTDIKSIPAKMNDDYWGGIK